MDKQSLMKSGIRVVMCLAGIIGNNWLGISSLPKSMSQLRPSDVLFVNLAVSNLITNYLVDTLDILFTEKYIPVGNVFCSIRFFLPEFSETSSILTTMYITVYWHQKLVGSLKRGGAPVRMDNFHVITVMLTGSWTFALVLNIAHLFFVVKINENITLVECVEELPSPEAGQAYKIVYITLANVIPLIGILYASIQITRTLLQNEKRMKKMGNGENSSAEQNGDSTNNVSAVTKSKSHAKTGSLVRAAKSVVAVAVLFLICWVIHLIVIVISSFSSSEVIEDIESFVGASYTCTIPYIYLYGVQRLSCCRRTGRVMGHERTVTH
ncbi:Alpha-1A adrenergic receptor [Bagarius yarrelli]|uniref:Alpha-1A adrenergic receptor n=1 Tax=Bagarius yarrelli TaxID=175774 RepID=A0A556U3F2_BAGYA|nr:Alpha-1A adrenergic receptor [Bagarius yarrelli]